MADNESKEATETKKSSWYERTRDFFSPVLKLMEPVAKPAAQFVGNLFKPVTSVLSGFLSPFAKWMKSGHIEDKIQSKQESTTPQNNETEPKPVEQKRQAASSSIQQDIQHSKKRTWELAREGTSITEAAQSKKQKTESDIKTNAQPEEKARRVQVP